MRAAVRVKQTGQKIASRSDWSDYVKRTEKAIL